MAIATVPDFVGAVRQSELLEPGPLNELLAESRRMSEVRALAQHAVKKGWLTPYQVNQVLTGQAAGLVLGNYRILERLGEGGMGQVFKARHRTMGRIVALKVIRKVWLDNDKAVRRFQREIHIAAKLTHPNIVLAYDADMAGGTHFFAMEYVEGTDLTRLVKEKGPLPVPKACEYVRQAAEGLQYAHDHGLVHRDIKPSNLLVTSKTSSKGTRLHLVKILDMGLARISLDEGEAAGGSLSQDGSVLGTPDYMAPEQAKNAKGVDLRADIYSLGCTLYYLLAGQVPFPGGSNIEKLLKHQMEEPRRIEELRPDIPEGLRAVLDKMMAKRAEDRYQSGGEAAAALVPFCGPDSGSPPSTQQGRLRRTSSGGNPARTITARLSDWLLPPSLRRSRRLAVALLSAVAVIIGAMFVLALTVGSGASPTRTQPGSSVAATTPTQTTPRQTRPEPQPQPAHLPVTRFLPDNADFVWRNNYRDFFQSGLFRQNETAFRNSYGDLGRFLLQYQIDLFKHVDRTALYTQVFDKSESVFFWVIQGSFDAKRFDQIMKGWQPAPDVRPVKGANGVYYKHASLPKYRPHCVAMINANTFIWSNEERYMTDAWLKATGRRPAGLADREVQAWLDNFGDKYTNLLVIGGTFTPPGPQGGKPLDSSGVRVLSCGWQIGDDIAADYTVTAKDAATAQWLHKNALTFFTDFFGYLGQPPVAAAYAGGIKKAVPDLKDRTVTVHGTYNPTESLKIFGQ